MNKKNKETGVEINCKTDKQVISSGKECTRILELGITAPVVETKTAKPPLNLSVVIDRSGSMGGDKLQYAKQAASHLVDLLDVKDRVGIVMYDTEIDVVSPSREMTAANKTLAKSEIQRISSRGSTNLFEGWLRGCHQVAEFDGNHSFNRTLLLSDGLANNGLTNSDEIASHVRELFQRNVSTSCFGIGIDYNEHLLEAMSNAGGGNFHFLEALSAIPISFEREFEELINLSLRAVSVELELPTGAICVLSGGWPGLQTGQLFTVSLGSLFSGQLQNLYFQLQLPASSKGTSLALPIKVKAQGADGTAVEIEQKVTFTVVDEAEEQQAVSDPELMARFALVDMADRAIEALKMARAGNRAEASTYLGQSMHMHDANMAPSTHQKYEHMLNEVNDGMSPMMFKRHHQEEYSNKRSRMDTRDYRLQLINGHLFTHIEHQHVLIDTGIPASLGTQPEFYFMQAVHPLSQGYLGVTLDQISRFVGAPIDILMGSDILKQGSVLFELARERVSFSPQPMITSQHRFPLSLLMGVPGVRADVLSQACEVFIDTGSKLSYISNEFTKGLTPLGVEKDFYPGMGEFETQVYAIDFSLGDLAFSLRCGVLPPLLEATLQVSGKKGILGAEFFEKFTVQLDFPGKTMILRA